ncbi:MAG: class F sortase [Nocardioides sp.]
MTGCAHAREPTSPVVNAAGDTTAAPAVPPAQRAASQVVPEAPRVVRLPSGTTVRVSAVGTRRDGRLAVPGDVRRAGWWRGGSRVGDPFGAMLVAGHVDSRTQGLGAYAELLTVRRGQEVVVRTASLRQTYRIRSLRLVPQARLATRPSLHSPRGPQRLVLVTCAPPYDEAHGGYQHLAVVTAYPAGRPSRRSG